ncbi:MAG: hypothetical protein J0H68_05865 [Sphingobacteriia bacterium]|nr:hypothetical protein [Sphingobacteriia bacterium]
MLLIRCANLTYKFLINILLLVILSGCAISIGIHSPEINENSKLLNEFEYKWGSFIKDQDHTLIFRANKELATCAIKKAAIELSLSTDSKNYFDNQLLFKISKKGGKGFNLYLKEFNKKTVGLDFVDPMDELPIVFLPTLIFKDHITETSEGHNFITVLKQKFVQCANDVKNPTEYLTSISSDSVDILQGAIKKRLIKLGYRIQEIQEKHKIIINASLLFNQKEGMFLKLILEERKDKKTFVLFKAVRCIFINKELLHFEIEEQKKEELFNNLLSISG